MNIRFKKRTGLYAKVYPYVDLYFEDGDYYLVKVVLTRGEIEKLGEKIKEFLNG